MPHVLVKGNADHQETRIFGLPQKEMDNIVTKLTPFGGRIGQDGQMFMNSPLHCLEILQGCFGYRIVASTAHGDQRITLWTLHRPFYNNRNH